MDKATKNSLGSISTLFSISDKVLAELVKASKAPTGTVPTPSDDDASDDGDDSTVITEDEAIERIKDRVREFPWEDMELLVAGMLRAMGYKTHMTQKGADGGRVSLCAYASIGAHAAEPLEERLELLDDSCLHVGVGVGRGEAAGLLGHELGNLGAGLGNLALRERAGHELAGGRVVQCLGGLKLVSVLPDPVVCHT